MLCANTHPAGYEDGDLTRPGKRWGAGAASVLPYLSKSLQTRPAETPSERTGLLSKERHAGDPSATKHEP